MLMAVRSSPRRLPWLIAGAAILLTIGIGVLVS